MKLGEDAPVHGAAFAEAQGSAPAVPEEGVNMCDEKSVDMTPRMKEVGVAVLMRHVDLMRDFPTPEDSLPDEDVSFALLQSRTDEMLLWFRSFYLHMQTLFVLLQ